MLWGLQADGGGTGGPQRSYLDFRPLVSEAVLGVRVWVRVDARAEDEYPVLSLDRENSLLSWNSLFLMAS